MAFNINFVNFLLNNTFLNYHYLFLHISKLQLTLYELWKILIKNCLKKSYFKKNDVTKRIKFFLLHHFVYFNKSLDFIQFCNYVPLLSINVKRFSKNCIHLKNCVYGYVRTPTFWN